MFLKISPNSQENACARVSFLVKLQIEACNFIKKDTVAQLFSSEFCENFNTAFCYRTLQVAAFYMLGRSGAGKKEQNLQEFLSYSLWTE